MQWTVGHCFGKLWILTQYELLSYGVVCSQSTKPVLSDERHRTNTWQEHGERQREGERRGSRLGRAEQWTEAT